MKTLDRYILKNFLRSALMCFLVLMALRIVADLFFNMDEFTKQKGGDDRSFVVIVSDILAYYSVHSLQYFRELSGVIIVAAAAFTLARMNHTNELTAILASGVSLHRVLLPVLLGTLALDAMVMLDTEVLIPAFKPYLVRSHDDPTGIDSFRVKLVTDFNRSCLYSRRFYPKQSRLDNPLLMLRDEDYTYLGHLAAPEAVFEEGRGVWVFRSTARDQAILSIPGAIKAPTNQFIPSLMGPEELLACVAARPENQSVKWDSAKCVQQLAESDPRNNLTIHSRQMDLEVVDGKPVGKILEDPYFVYTLGPREVEIDAKSAEYGELDGQPGWRLTDGVIVYRSDMTPSDLALRQSGQWMQYMSTSEMAQLLELRQTSDPEQVTLMRHSRFADFMNNIIMLLVGVPFILSRERNLKASAGLTVLVVGGFYVFIYLSRYLGIHPPVLAAWLPILIFGPIAAAMVDAVKT